MGNNVSKYEKRRIYKYSKTHTNQETADKFRRSKSTVQKYKYKGPKEEEEASLEELFEKPKNQCNVPDQMETQSKKEARYGLIITYSEPWQKGILAASENREDAIKKIQCEHNRVRTQLKEKHNIDTEKYKELEIKI